MKQKITLLFVIVSIRLLSQIPGNERAFIANELFKPSTSYTNVIQRADAYFESLNEDSVSEEVEELEEYYHRWRAYWDSRVWVNEGPTGGSVMHASNIIAAVQPPNCAVQSNSLNPWQPIGPLTSPAGLSGIGKISAVCINTASPNKYYACSTSGGIFMSNNSAASWTNVLSGFYGRDIAVAPNNANEIYCATGLSEFGEGYGYGVIESFDGGLTWNADTNTSSNYFNEFRSATASGISFRQNGGVTEIFVGAGKNIWRKICNGQAGNTWTKSNLDTSIKFNQPLSYLDAQNSTQTYTTNRTFDQVIVDPNNPSRVYATLINAPGFGASRIVYSQDGGVNFTSLPLPTNYPDLYDAVAIDMTPAAPGYLYAFYRNRKTDHVFAKDSFVLARTSNLGSSWFTNVISFGNLLCCDWNYGGYGFYSSSSFKVSRINAGVFYVGGTTNITFTISGNNGLQFGNGTAYFPNTGNNVHADIRDIFVTSAANTETLLIATDGGINQSTNHGLSYSDKNGTGLNCTQFYGFTHINKNDLFFGGSLDNGIIKKSAQGFSPYISGDCGWIENLFNTDSIISINDAGAQFLNYTNSTSYPTVDPNTRTESRFFVDPTKESLIFKGGNDTTINQSRFIHPSTVIDSTIYVPGKNWINSIAVAPSNSNIVMFAHAGPTWGQSSNRLYLTKNRFQSYKNITDNAIFGNYDVRHILFDPINPRYVYMAVSGWSGTGSSGSMRVVKSSDTGSTWVDISTGLPPHPVNYLVYHNGSKGIIYAATDAGVYKYDGSQSNPTWQCYNAGLPYVPVTKLEIDYCNSKLYASTFGRGMYASSLPTLPADTINLAKVQAINGNSSNTLTLGSGFYQHLNNRIIVESGVVLKVNGHLDFGPTGDMVIKNGARMVVTGTLNSGCPTQWPGLQVEGNANAYQTMTPLTNTTHAILELSGATIANANIAINSATSSVCNNCNGYSRHDSTSGAMVLCANSKFVNNKTDLAFFSYKFKNQSRLANCTLVTNQNYIGNASMVRHVDMEKNDGIVIDQCKFKYTGSSTNYSDHGTGIYANNTLFKVISSCPISPCTNHSQFENLKFGIVVTNSNSILTFSVSNTLFINNYMATRFEGVDLVKFNFNTINTGTTVGGKNGVYAYNSQLFAIENNTLTGNAANSFVVGITAVGCFGGQHNVYLNTFEKLSTGVQSLNQNAGLTNGLYTGLYMKCNAFGQTTSNIQDIYIHGSNAMVEEFHGANANSPIGVNLSKLIGNRYSLKTCGNSNRIFANTLLNNVKHFNNNSSSTIIVPQPNCSSNIIFPVTSQYSYTPSQCLTKLISASDNISLKNITMSSNSAYKARKRSIDSIIDMGRTNYFINLVNSNLPLSSKKMAVDSIGPFVSDTVLLGFITPTACSFGDLFEIYKRNSPVSLKVYTVIQSKGFSSTEQDSIFKYYSAEKYSKRDSIFSLYAEAHSELLDAGTELIRRYLLDSVEVHKDTIIKAINLLPSYISRCLKVQYLIAKHKELVTTTMIDTLHWGSENVDHQCKLFKAALPAIQGDSLQAFYRHNTDFYNLVHTIANDTLHDGHGNAQAMIQVFDTLDYYRTFVHGNYDSGARKAYNSAFSDEQKNLQEAQGITLVPNPTQGQLTILGLRTGGFCKVFNTLQQKIYSTPIGFEQSTLLDISHLPNGIYLVYIESLDKSKQVTFKIILQK